MSADPPLENSPDEEGYTLARNVMRAITPVIGGHPTARVIDAMATAFVATLTDHAITQHDARRLIGRYIRRMLDYTEEMQ
jgi:hypothetical protein